MIQDDEYEVLITTPERIEALGFKPQKESLTNHVLPYADELDKESTRFLEQVKTNLAKAVVLREMKPACGIWSSRLMKYIRIYGLKFGKEDHIALIKLAYELVLIPELEPCKVHKFITMFLMLAKKRHLISPEELTLPWRPLCELGKTLFDKNSTNIGMFHYLSSLESSYVSMVKCAKPYFDVSATKEILAEYLPQIPLWSGDTHIMIQLTLFLPVGLHPRHAVDGHELWFNELMALWDTCYNAQCGVSELMSLFSGLAKRNPGAVNWTPYIPKMFMRFLHALNLPVSYKDMQYTRSHSLDIKHVASWIVWTISPDGLVLKHLRSFLAGVESYLHSANSGRWSFRLRDLLRKLAREFLNRVRREREKRFQESWENQPPESYKLRDEDITEFVNIVLEPTLQAVYSRSGSLDISMALQNLATLRPAIVVPPLIERLRTTLTSLTEPHRVTAAMSAVAAVSRSMVRGAENGYPEGPTHVVPLLLAILPGLDPNDIKKTLVSLHYILIFSWMVPYIDCSSAYEHWSDLTEEELLTCESTAQLEDFVLMFLDRIFVIIESSILEHARLDTKESDCARSKMDAVMETAISSAAMAVLMQCSPKIFKEALRKFRGFATNTTFETNVSGSMVGVLLRVFARVNAKATLDAFLPTLCSEVDELLSTGDALREENPPQDLLYRLVLLMHVVQCDGSVLINYIPDIIPVLDKALHLHASQALARACDILNYILHSLSNIELKEWRSSPKDYSEAPEKWLPIREWGKGCLLTEVDLKWHVPSQEEAEVAQMLVNRYLEPEVTRLRQWMSKERPMCRKRKLRSFHIISAVMSCSTFLPPSDETPITLIESQIPTTNLQFTSGVNYTINFEGKNLRVALTRLLLDVQSTILDYEADDTRGLEILIQVWERLVTTKSNQSGPGVEARARSYNALERALDGRGGCGTGSARLRALTADAAQLHHDARQELAADAVATPAALNAMHALFELSINTYSSVRMQAQTRLFWMLTHYPYSYRALIPRITRLLEAGGDDDEWHARHKGALYIVLGPRSGPLIAKQDWEVVRALWPAILRTSLSEKPSIIRLEQAFSDSVHRHFPTVNTGLTMSASVVNAAKYFLNEAQLIEPEFAKLVATAAQTEMAESYKTEKIYLELVEELVKIAEAPNVQWRRLELAMQLLSYCPLLQTRYPPRAIALMTRSLLHDDIAVRRTAHKLVHFALKQRKRKLKKITVDPYKVAMVPKPEKRVPGYRKDLEWAIWSESRIPKTDEEWDRPWLRDPSIAFYAWPEKLVVAAPFSEQNFALDLEPEKMEAGERYLYDFFSDEANINKLVAFLTVEEKKGKDKFNGIRFSMFRYLFAHFGGRVSQKLLEHALRCASETQEAPQRFAAEIASAALRAPRYWPRERALAMYNSAMEIIKTGLTTVTPETWEDWGTCIATGVEKLDPHRGGTVLQTLLELCAPPPAHDDCYADQNTSFVVCARLYALQGALASLTWRGAPLASELLRRLEAANFTQHPYQNVRETVGSILMTMFDTELVFPGGDSGEAPRLKDFLTSVLPRLAVLFDKNGDLVIKTATPIQNNVREEKVAVAPTELGPVLTDNNEGLKERSPSPSSEESPQTINSSSSSESETELTSDHIEKQLVARLDTTLRIAGDTPPLPAPKDHARAVNLLTTALRVNMSVIVRGIGSGVHYELVPVACAAGSRGCPQPLDELPRAAAGFLASLALANHSPAQFELGLATLENLATARSWWARLACLDFAQPFLFYGLPMLCENAAIATRAENLAMLLMNDARLEVRQSAAKLLTGLMHCRALPDEEKTLRNLMRSCKSKQLVERHSGVLGLCAYLSSRPYSLAPQLGKVLEELSRHTNAPDPIPATIRTTLAEFRRTHNDDWPKHREQLTEEELDWLADLTSPPSYCA